MDNITTTPYGTVEYYTEMLEGIDNIDGRALQLINTALISGRPAQQVIWVSNVLEAHFVRAAR